MKLFVAALLVIAFATNATAQEALCTCTEAEVIHNFTTVNPDDIDFMEDFPWQVVSCSGSQVFVKLVTEDNPLLDSYVEDEDGNERIYYNGEWIRFDEFKPQCNDAPTS
ncbi:hypothetical protein K2P47_01160 [Patescibacteria group bacterium]|nr:hypothetical protein [Patescibacteria group bacterium]